MGLIVPRCYNVAWQSNLVATPSATAPGTLVTADVTSHTKGAYAQLVASTTRDWFGFWLSCTNSAATGADSAQLLDIAIGGAGSEVVILNNWLAGARGSAAFASLEGQYIPLYIPAGTRISARNQSLISADTVHVTVVGQYGTSNIAQVFNCCDTYGVDTADSGGTAHTPGNTGAESTDATIGTTDKAYGAVSLGVTLGSGVTAGGNLINHWEFTDGTNTFAEWYSTCDSSETIHGPYPTTPFWGSIPSGQALQVQAECNSTGQIHDVAFYCFY
jgi:hypothetical protein